DHHSSPSSGARRGQRRRGLRLQVPARMARPRRPRLGGGTAPALRRGALRLDGERSDAVGRRL
ncbi:MAG: hypothetical protein AVDCRST_MAG57-2595, partial [uncultured Blastococcus sp.]